MLVPDMTRSVSNAVLPQRLRLGNVAMVVGALVIGLNVFADRIAASEPERALSQRFAEPDTEAVPDFQKHIVPLLGRLGCNGRACHGSFQGRGGLQFSLFGYDFKADHQALMEAGSGRVDLDDTDESLILAKPSDAEAHEGGKRFALGSWQHHVLRRWIETGGKFDPQQIQTLDRLEVQPDEIRFNSADASVDLKVIAHWADGTSETVTQLSRFHTNNDAIASIDKNGTVTAAEHGDTHVVVCYDNSVVPIPVIRPFAHSSPPAAYNWSHPIDQIVQSKLDKLNIMPSGRCSDADFVRRVSLDITGLLPPGELVRDFLADPSPDKRTALIDSLLESPGYAAWWATRFSDWTGNNAEQLNNVLPIRDVASGLWYEWLRTRIDENIPYDEIVEGIVTAQSRQPEETYLDYCKAMSEACKPGNEKLFAARDGLPMYWSRRDFQKPEDRAIGFAYTFLGVRIECAQCHKHPFDRWSKEDFGNFARLFSPIRSNANAVAPDAKDERMQLISSITDGEELKGGRLRRSLNAAAKQGKTVPFAELLVNTRAIKAKAKKAARKNGRDAPMRIPSGKILGELDNISLEADTRPALMEWLRSPDNPYFVKAIVNRVWSNYFGNGIVDPTDDMNLGNPPSNAALLDHLSAEFIKHDYDLKWLHRWIVTSETYQRSAETNDTNALDRKNFARHIPRRLPAEVVYDAVVLATGSNSQAAKRRDQLHKLAIADGIPRRRNKRDFALTVFGQSIRESNCDCDRSDSPSLLQSIYLRNDRDVHARLTARDGWVNQACAAIGAQGPSPQAGNLQGVELRQATAMKTRFLERLQAYKEQPEKRRKKLRPQIKRDRDRIAQKMGSFGFETPSLAQLIDQPNPWQQLQPVQADQPERAQQSIEEIVTEAYLRTLSRYPDPEETEISVSYIRESEKPAEGIESLLWALINTKEFIITH